MSKRWYVLIIIVGLLILGITYQSIQMMKITQQDMIVLENIILKNNTKFQDSYLSEKLKSITSDGVINNAEFNEVKNIFYKVEVNYINSQIETFEDTSKPIHSVFNDGGFDW
ncbi:hypothetical protein GNP80_08960 [Aliivibrio fischeri]|uniref:hypothetical protein n=1 Tax=Aliivibrio fischeri TaxID=668 RepID=UPI0012D9A06B|nr:hypothetical protein [Aliivibrio fischeri]MUK92571.1 hypothetical protein [Aliivibrio fischeri]